MRLIDADVFMNELNEAQQEFDEYYRGLGRAKVMLLTQPLIDAEPVVHGHWIECSNELNKKCSVCHKVNGTIYYHEPHCPNCGAKMDEVSK